MSSINLTDLKSSQVATILALNIDHKMQHRFAALGLRCGQQVHLLRRAWMQGPLHLRVGMTEIMLRRCDARQISIAILDGIGEAA
jgi:ferrous iron transport protein A